MGRKRETKRKEREARLTILLRQEGLGAKIPAQVFFSSLRQN